MEIKDLLVGPMFVIELILLGLNWIVALISPRLGKKFIEWNIRTLPDKKWYLGEPK